MSKWIVRYSLGERIATTVVRAPTPGDACKVLQRFFNGRAKVLFIGAYEGSELSTILE